MNTGLRTTYSSYTPTDVLVENLRMIEGKDALTETQRKDILQALRKVRDEEGLTIQSLSEILGCSTSVVSTTLSEKYDGDTDKYLLIARDWMAERSSRLATPTGLYVKTEIATRILTVCTLAWMSPAMAKIVTPSGCGKSAALQEFARQRGNKCAYFQAGEGSNTKTGVVRALARAMPIKIADHDSTADIIERISDRIAAYYQAGKGSHYCIIVDEATTLRPAAINVLRQFHDDLRTRACVILADTDRLDRALDMRRKTIAGGIEQLTSRFGPVMTIGGAPAHRKKELEISRADVRAVAEAQIRSFGHTARLDAGALNYLHHIAQRAGYLRNVTHRISAVRVVAEQLRQTPTYSAAQLDYVGEMLGDDWTMSHSDQPFGGAARTQAAETPRRVAV
jgi:DNA transposition AAA+ family ATPase